MSRREEQRTQAREKILNAAAACFAEKGYSGCSVQDIADRLSMTQSAISHQLRVLKQMSLVKFRRDGKTIYYSLADSHVATIMNQGLEHVTEE